MNARQQVALELIQSGLSIIPIRPDGTKSPTLKWERYQHERAGADEVLRWFDAMHSGIGIIGGEISGGLEILDFDDARVFEPWANLVNQLYEELLALLPTVQTPTGGYHVYYRAHGVAGNQKLARAWKDGKPDAVKIETRGEGGYVLSPYCHPDCHSLRRVYSLLHGDLRAIPLISQEARRTLLNSARAFNEYIEPPKPKMPQRVVSADERPGDTFSRTHSWHDVLEPFGWKAVRRSGDTVYWKRPGKDDDGWSASTNHNGRDLLYVFSSNAAPFEENHGYAKFTVWTLLRFRGDFSAAAKAVLKG